MEGVSLGVIFKWRVVGVFWWGFASVIIGCELGSKHGCFLGNFGMDPSWVMWNFV